jgi:hypothetical protein
MMATTLLNLINGSTPIQLTLTASARVVVVVMMSWIVRLVKNV